MRVGCRFYKARENGFILVTVLFVTTLFLGTATAFAWFARQEVARARLLENSVAARSVAVVACRKAADWIGEDTNNFDSPREFLYMVPIVLTFGDWVASVAITPLDNKIPINKVFLPDGVTMRNEYTYAWGEIWKYLDKGTLAPLVMDFLDRDNVSRAGSMEQEYFANGSISELTQLSILPGMDSDVIYGTKDRPGGLERFFTIFCGDRINFNTADRSVLEVLDESFARGGAATIISHRATVPLRSIKDIQNLPGISKTVVTRLNNVIGFSSIYYRVKLHVIKGSFERNFIVTLQKGGSKCTMIRWDE